MSDDSNAATPRILLTQDRYTTGEPCWVATFEGDDRAIGYGDDERTAESRLIAAAGVLSQYPHTDP